MCTIYMLACRLCQEVGAFACISPSVPTKLQAKAHWLAGHATNNYWSDSGSCVSVGLGTIKHVFKWSAGYSLTPLPFSSEGGVCVCTLLDTVVVALLMYTLYV